VQRGARYGTATDSNTCPHFQLRRFSSTPKPFTISGLPLNDLEKFI
jgi:hypothetical protein